MHSQWTAITEKNGQGWVAYFQELPQAVTFGTTLDEARESLDWAVNLILEAGRGGAELSDLAEDPEAVESILA